ncbi:nitroreductase family protein [Vallitalea okinawensis]|uniref:nitroreductase family protein n=1 Tax=Vallitalea okinawensis TaxID=2078660 RepID=UPI000CFDD795|nr:nitroreductase family protein [Vallitalea okinawensis]
MYNAIEKRISIRKYSGGIGENLLSKVKAWSENLESLNPDIPVKFHVVKEGEQVSKYFKSFMDRYMKVYAPHYILVTTEKKDNYLENLGYMGEQLVLKMATEGIGTCWVGSNFKDHVVKQIIQIPQQQQYIIMIAFGKPENPLNSILERKRKALSEISNGRIVSYDTIIKALQIAPSAINSQPWKVKIWKNEIHLYYDAPKKIYKKMIQSLNKIDLGIGLCHMVEEARYEGMDVELVKDQEKKREQDYFMTLHLQSS